ncbi:MAG: ATP-binding protein [Spirochaetaceae bacterium]|nr:ATP-binding protein [Spirochaetaceae bacterium]
MSNEVAIRQNPLVESLERADDILRRSYLLQLHTCPIVRDYVNPAGLAESLNGHVRFFEISRIVINKNECMRDKLVSVFNAVANTGASFLFQVRGSRDKVSLHVGVRTCEDVFVAQKVLASSLSGNFPGMNISDVLNKEQLEERILDNFKEENKNRVTSVSDIAGIRAEEESRERQFVQGLEKVIDAMRGRDYTLFLIADSITPSDLNTHRRALENLYTQLVPLSSAQLSYGENSSTSLSESLTQGVSQTINASITDSVTHTVGKNSSVTHSSSGTDTWGTSDSDSKFSSVGLTVNIGHFGISKSRGTARTTGTSKSHSEGESLGVTSGSSSSNATGRAETRGESLGKNMLSTVGSGTQQGQSFTVQVQEEQHSITRMLERIDKMLERYDTCADLGMWNCAMYCVGDEQTVQTLASIYRSIVRGQNSSLENGSIVVWSREESARVMDYLRTMEHPRFNLNGMEVTPGTLVSSAELAIQAGLPNRSVPGIPVLECAEFGRTVSSFDSQGQGREVKLGSIFHMHHQEELPVALKLDSLTSHTFVTGSTGSGKSNTIYRLLKGLSHQGVNFLVVEPAKGEYKEVLGGLPGVSVYGTNPQLTPLLRINPFSFPHGNEEPSRNIHILEHLDRLIEIFNVCWPMYAAMPAVLKEAVEKSYEDCGWNLTESTNPYGDDLYPTFADVTRNIRTIIDSSEYDAENKGAYKGALVTRLKSLTNGINGLIFTTEEISAQELFDRKVIVDLSRVGSTETKSLIMGLLVLKLQEHRMTEGDINSPLRHVTVLEEAHNLLKRTSTEQSQDSGNLLGKSVEMLANAIAEMRTYGEGFIIADQAPGLLDLSVIRNTNTKIIMRLPDQDDRELVGRAANLNDDQITELARLPVGVAAVYQNNWIEPVLCQVEKYREKNEFTFTKREASVCEKTLTFGQRLEIARLLCEGTKWQSLEEAQELTKDLGLSSCAQVQVIRLLRNPSPSPRYTKLAPVMAELFPQAKSALAEIFEKTSETGEWTDTVDREIKSQSEGQDIDEELLRSIRQCIITQLLHNELGKTELLERWSKEGGRI